MNKNKIRIIPKLDIKNGTLIKGINLEGLRILGNAKDFANLYYKDGADEGRTDRATLSCRRHSAR